MASEGMRHRTERIHSLKTAKGCFESVKRTLIEDCDYFRRNGMTDRLERAGKELEKVNAKLEAVDGELAGLGA